MKIGPTSSNNLAKQGFSYIELMVSVLILSTGFIGYTELISRVKFTQQHASDNLQSIMLADYQQQNALIDRDLCANTKP